VDRRSDIEAQLVKDYELLNRIESQLRVEDDPKRQAKLEQDIAKLQEQIQSRRAELVSLSADSFANHSPKRPSKAKKERKQQWVRGLAVPGLILISILCISGIAVWRYTQSLPSKEIIVLVANFDKADSKNFDVTETIIDKLRQATEKYSNVKIQSLDKSMVRTELGSNQADGAKLLEVRM
jgi:hypothetical protein